MGGAKSEMSSPRSARSFSSLLETIESEGSAGSITVVISGARARFCCASSVSYAASAAPRRPRTRTVAPMARAYSTT